MTRQDKWLGSPPIRCGVCQRFINDAFVDGKTSKGPWVVMCIPCWASLGVGLGTGKGQLYRDIDGDYWKEAG